MGCTALPITARSSAAQQRAPRAPACRFLAPLALRSHQIQQQQASVGRVRASDGDLDELAELPTPDTCRGAIALGLKLTEAGQWERAQEYFERALELPGTGVKRFRDKPAGLSDGEKQSILYNCACCQAQLGQPENIQNGLLALAGCLESGAPAAPPAVPRRRPAPPPTNPAPSPPSTPNSPPLAPLQATPTSASFAPTRTWTTSAARSLTAC